MIKETNRRLLTPSKPLNYLVIGHVTADLKSDRVHLGGTATFSSLTAQALGLTAGVITSHSSELDTSPLKSLWLLNKASHHTTTFKNISDGITRTQYLYAVAAPLTEADIPTFDVPPDIVHLGPVANEVDLNVLQSIPKSLKCLTPQGWLRQTNADHHVIPGEWENYEKTLHQADIAVISNEDVQMREDLIAHMAGAIPIFVVTENYKGARVYWHNDARFIHAPEVKYVDDTGAGDIFATAFFYRYFHTRDPWEAGRFAVNLASWSVTRAHLESIPTPEEIKRAKLELIGN
jgi:sugar/nucleoside kinase (ribokinase family)